MLSAWSLPPLPHWRPRDSDQPLLGRISLRQHMISPQDLRPPLNPSASGQSKLGPVSLIQPPLACIGSMHLSSSELFDLVSLCRLDPNRLLLARSPSEQLVLSHTKCDCSSALQAPLQAKLQFPFESRLCFLVFL
jgi:hypothetical protein